MKHMAIGCQEALALLYSDGTASILLPEADLARAEEEREFVDGREQTTGNLSRIAKVRVEVLEILADPTNPKGSA